MPGNAHDVAAAVLAHVGPVEAMRLQKLVYYSQAWHLALTDEPLFLDTIQAWRDGPVTPSLWDEHRGQRTIRSWPAGDPGRLGATSAKVIALVCQVYGDLSGDDLSELTHNEEPWSAARRGATDDQRSKATIRVEDMKRFYRSRSLTGRRVADLVSGGFHGPADPDLSAGERREILADIREEFRRSETDDASETPEHVVTAFRVSGDINRQPHVVARLNRERPPRGSATPPG